MEQFNIVLLGYKGKCVDHLSELTEKKVKYSAFYVEDIKKLKNQPEWIRQLGMDLIFNVFKSFYGHNFYMPKLKNIKRVAAPTKSLKVDFIH